MKHKFVPIWGLSDSKWEPLAYIGPVKNLKPVSRKKLNSIDRQSIIIKQKYKCNMCDEKIKLYPFANCDADHIIPISLGGLTVQNNMQLLCVQHHRGKTALENKGTFKYFEVNITTDSDDVYIFNTDISPEKYQIPVDIKSPLDAINQECNLSLLRYENIKRNYNDLTECEIDAFEFIQSFAYNP